MKSTDKKGTNHIRQKITTKTKVPQELEDDLGNWLQCEEERT